MLAVDATQALSDYLAMGPQRSLGVLHRRYIEQHGTRSPAVDTVRRWSMRGKWSEIAVDFDRKASARLIEHTQTLIVQHNRSRLQSLEMVAEQCLDDALGMRVKGEDATAQDKRALVSTAIDAIKLIEVLTGGVSDRTSRVSALANEAVSALRELEDRARRRELVIDVTPDAAGHTDNPLEPAPAEPHKP